MELSGRYFSIALLLSIAAGIVGNIYNWLYYFVHFTPADFMIIRITLTPISLAFSTILPFILMYLQAKKISLEANLIPILISAFLGTWIGRLITDIGIHTFIVYYTGGYYAGYTILESAIILMWQVIVLSLSPTIFILATAILLAHYQKRKGTHLPQPPSPFPS